MDGYEMMSLTGGMDTMKTNQRSHKNELSVAGSEVDKSPARPNLHSGLLEPMDNMNANYARTSNFLDSGTNEAKLQDLHNRLNLLLDRHKKK